MSKYKDHLDQEGRDLQARADALTQSMKTYKAHIDQEAHSVRERAAHEMSEFRQKTRAMRREYEVVASSLSAEQQNTQNLRRQLEHSLQASHAAHASHQQDHDVSYRNLEAKANR